MRHPRRRFEASSVPEPPTEAPWNAARCERTLRQLTNFLDQLRDWHEDFRAAQAADSIDDSAAARSEQESGPGSWLNLAQKQSKRKTKTYGTRRQRKCPERATAQRNEREQPIDSHPTGDFGTEQAREMARILLTPVTARTGGRDTPSYTQRAGPNTENEREMLRNEIHLLLRSRDCKHPQEWPEFTFSLAGRPEYPSDSYEVLASHCLTIFNSFLSATAKPSCPRQWEGSRPKGEQGAKSLFSMSQKAVAKSMLCKDNGFNRSGEDTAHDTDTALVTFQELEEHYGDVAVGWSPLRGITRDYGIQAICDCIASGTLRANVARELAIQAFMCPLLSDAGEAIVESMIDVQSMFEPSTPTESLFDCHAMPAFAALAEYNHGYSDIYRQEFRWRMLRRALEREYDPLSPVWFLKGSFLTQGFRRWADGRIEAGLLIRAVFHRSLGLASGDLSEQLRGTIRSGSQISVSQMIKPFGIDTKVLSGMLSAIFNMLVGHTPQSRGHILQDMCVPVMQLLEIQDTANISLEHQKLMAHILFATVCVGLANHTEVDSRRARSLEAFVVGSQFRKQLTNSLTGLLVDLGRNYAAVPYRHRNLSAFKTLVDNLAAHPTDQNPVLALFLANIAAHAAMDFSWFVEGQEHVEWASEVQERLVSRLREQDVVPATPSMAEHVSGYRWDDALEEWIAKTPATLHHNKFPVISERAVSTDFETADPSDTPMPRRRTKHSLEQMIITHGASNIFPKKQRMSSLDAYEVCRDGDFEYRKLKRKSPSTTVGDRQTSSGPIAKQVRCYGKMAVGEESEDELSILA